MRRWVASHGEVASAQTCSLTSLAFTAISVLELGKDPKTALGTLLSPHATRLMIAVFMSHNYATCWRAWNKTKKWTVLAEQVRLQLLCVQNGMTYSAALYMNVVVESGYWSPLSWLANPLRIPREASGTDELPPLWDGVKVSLISFPIACSASKVESTKHKMESYIVLLKNMCKAWALLYLIGSAPGCMWGGQGGSVSFFG